MLGLSETDPALLPGRHRGSSPSAGVVRPDDSYGEPLPVLSHHENCSRNARPPRRHLPATQLNTRTRHCTTQERPPIRRLLRLLLISVFLHCPPVGLTQCKELHPDANHGTSFQVGFQSATSDLRLAESSSYLLKSNHLSSHRLHRTNSGAVWAERFSYSALG